MNTIEVLGVILLISNIGLWYVAFKMFKAFKSFAKKCNQEPDKQIMDAFMMQDKKIQKLQRQLCGGAN